MPSVNLSPETYAKLKDYAAQQGTSLDEAAARAIESVAVVPNRSAEARRTDWDAALREIRANLPEGLTEDEVAADVAAAIQEVRAANRARGH